MSDVFDGGFATVENPDLEKGRIEQRAVEVSCRYAVEREKQGEFRVVAEYDNGGKDVEFVETSPEVGAWHVYRDGAEWPECPLAVPDDWPHEQAVETTVFIDVYTPYTDEELAAIKERREAAEKAAQEAADKAEVMDSLPDAVADLSEVVSTQADDSASLADAVAELSQLVSDLTESKSN